MKSEKLLLTQNWKEIEEAKNLGIKVPDPIKVAAKTLFWKKDIKRVIVDDDKMIVEFYDENSYELGYEEKIWKDLERYFIKNEERF